MTNPGNIVRVRARRGGRASVYEANCLCQAFSSGFLYGRGVVQNTVANMNVLVGGSPDNPDAVIAKTPTGYRVALDLVGQQPLQITKPATGSRVSQIVAYTNDLSLITEETSTTGSPNTCGLIVVNGTGATAPTDAQIRSAITADGGTGSQAAYAVLASVTVASTATAISNGDITRNTATMLIPLGYRLTADNFDFSTMKKWVPDYSKKTSLALDASGKATVTQTGWVVYYYFGYTPGDSHEVKIFVNDVKIFSENVEARGPNDTTATIGDTMFPVSAGDVITVQGSDGGKSAIFIPGKFV